MPKADINYMSGAAAIAGVRGVALSADCSVDYIVRAHGCAAQNPVPCRPPMSNLNGGQNDGAYNYVHGCRPATGGVSAAIRHFKSSEGVHRAPILSYVRLADVVGSH